MNREIALKRIPWEMIFCMGMIVGIVIMGACNQSGSNNAYLLDTYTLYQIRESRVEADTFFYFIIRKRMGTVLFLTIAASTYLGVVLCVCSAFLFGVAGGAFLTAAVLKYGMKGFFLVLVSVLPQAILYVPAFYFLFEWCVKVKQVMYQEKIKKMEPSPGVILHILLIWVVFFAGCMVESYLNPMLLHLFLNVF